MITCPRNLESKACHEVAQAIELVLRATASEGASFQNFDEAIAHELNAMKDKNAKIFSPVHLGEIQGLAFLKLFSEMAPRQLVEKIFLEQNYRFRYSLSSLLCNYVELCTDFFL